MGFPYKLQILLFKNCLYQIHSYWIENSHWSLQNQCFESGTSLLIFRCHELACGCLSKLFFQPTSPAHSYIIHLKGLENYRQLPHAQAPLTIEQHSISKKSPISSTRRTKLQSSMGTEKSQVNYSQKEKKIAIQIKKMSYPNILIRQLYTLTAPKQLQVLVQPW